MDGSEVNEDSVLELPDFEDGSKSPPTRGRKSDRRNANLSSSSEDSDSGESDCGNAEYHANLGSGDGCSQKKKYNLV